MRVNFDTLVARIGQGLPAGLLRPLLRLTLGGSQVALCLHRVQERKAKSFQPELSIEPENLDRLIGLLLSCRDPAQRWLTVTFDDGYLDAARYLQERSGRFPMVEFLFFVCPQKSELQAGFRWDLAQAAPEEQLDLERENLRPELKAVASQPQFAVAAPAFLRELSCLPNVQLGNHSNCHFMQTRMDSQQSAREFEQSTADFERLFGPVGHFAFPFGTPEREFNASHVAQLRTQGPFLIWSTEPRPHRPQERNPQAVLPRYPVNGRWNYRGISAWIAARAAYAWWRGPRAHYPLAVTSPAPSSAIEPPPAQLGNG